MAMNTAASEKLKGIGAEFMVLMWDQEAKRIALKVVTDDKTAYRITYGVKGNGAGFSAKTFLDFIAYDQSKSSSYSIEWNDNEKMFEVALPAESFLRS
jgi:hypothetical protein